MSGVHPQSRASEPGEPRRQAPRRWAPFPLLGCAGERGIPLPDSQRPTCRCGSCTTEDPPWKPQTTPWPHICAFGKVTKAVSLHFFICKVGMGISPDLGGLGEDPTRPENCPPARRLCWKQNLTGIRSWVDVRSRTPTDRVVIVSVVPELDDV